MKKPLWARVKTVALLPLVLLVGLYSAFGVVFLFVPGQVVQAVVGVAVKECADGAGIRLSSRGRTARRSGG